MTTPPDASERAFWYACWRALTALAAAVLAYKLGNDQRPPTRGT